MSVQRKSRKAQVAAPAPEAPRCAHCEPDTATVDGKSVVQPRKKALLNRLSRIGGQVNGIAQMIEKDRYCVDILTQVSAVRSALDAVASQLLADHANGCVRQAILEDGGEEAITELLGIIKKMR
ncbi:metal-sensitive transcriptional regulator [Stutzerimonas kirkiae]|uniref:Transcriptional regulator n=1 Tax=Stutzerimonas kirkiae TaxID=2211392 RepID=A0A4Q9R3A6_9GAMM|nr:metal-sensitive transcriptional regulator [Stutzerimonas kirkiae]TBU92822.1 transcriptional regulator [Stutzerimonas kirkiae]TBV01285.1 transcriptional regulator [Stutzerimonas kirkiae]TBV10744.1 transcriptional regulator [Stutzerimonas kirkiae]TBV14536.1 transcriptional regulator [Stutzerimonas kirkiae]